ncbi:MAG: sigma-54-dependent Fis family transcriptional regulator [Planctomycetes bacterium]|nr:sigma-54-dependent Fis family transcriptional regulator [Planctomycetota bacterium]
MSRILLIDDEAAARLVLQNRLKDLGHDVVLAENGAKGLLEAREGGFDVILVEAGLGAGISGIEVCRRIKQVPQSALTPLVMVARSGATREDVHQAYEAGCEHVLQKADMVGFEDVLRTALRSKAQSDEFARQLRAVEAEMRRKIEERQHENDRELARGDSGEHALVGRDLAAGKPDGVMLVDAEGIVRCADRGARELLGASIEGKNLGRLAPNTRLEAFVRDAHTESREGYRFDVRPTGARTGRALIASVVPLVANPGERDPGMRVVILLDAGKRRVATELLRVQEYSIPRREVGVLMEAARRAFGAVGVIGNSTAVRAARSAVNEFAHSSEPVLLLGQPGVGKQHLARSLHFSGSLTGPFLPLSCAALSAANLDSELFGHVRGATPEAVSDRPGMIQQSAHGTIYLSEVDHLPLELQKKLLRALRDGEVVRVGAERVERCDSRFVFSAEVDLVRLASQGLFLAELIELFGRRTIVLPTLRERREDIPALAQHFLERFAASRNDMEVSDEALAVLEAHEWPGNIRELETVVERAVAATQNAVIDVLHLPAALRELHGRMGDHVMDPAPRPDHVTIGGGVHLPSSSTPLPTSTPSPFGQPTRARQPWDIDETEELSLDLYEKKCLIRALNETGNDKLAAARLLKVGKSTLYRKLKRFGIT